MKKIILAALLAAGLSACADTRSHVSDDGNTWETIRYQENRQNP
ncbi:lipoprotein [Conchiformibius steedae DSM 2580]|uniref:Lipoprotein n=1 Tax=Conchiformibius steedae DSM 2580 TaxID=1121352 RepID=A0AAE9HVD0_9NEIS|nr:lipoprotein [Conchiformibius steedae]QMT34307.1 lipoprotein [Conchiformibius steedae]URD67082.1 lipoprotein [Conchiformibius steedae DSM 2580]